MTRKNSADSRRQLMHRLHTEGVWHAYQAEEDVCKDKTAPAPARATASAIIFRAAGYFNAKAGVDASEKEPQDMTPEEIQARIDQLREARSLRADDDQEDDLDTDDGPD